MAKKNSKTSALKVQAAGAGAVPAVPQAGAAAASDPALIQLSLRASADAEQAAAEAAGRARQIRLTSLDLDEKADALGEEIRANNLSGDCAQIEIDINASKVKVEALTAQDVRDLTALSLALDRRIVSSQLLTAALTGVTQVLESVVKVRDILSSPSLQV